MVVLTASALVNCTNNYTRGYQALLFPTNCLVQYTIKLTTYVVLMMKADKIGELVEYLQMVVGQRK